MTIFLTLLNNFVWFLAVEFYILMGWGSEANVFLISLPIIYVLTEGSEEEKRELLSNLKSEIVMKNKVLSLK